MSASNSSSSLVTSPRWGHAGASPSRWFSLKMALIGARHLLLSQPNARIAAVCAIGAMGAGWWLHISSVEWAVLLMTVFLVLALEAVNTAIEAVVDLASPAVHPLAKVAKDVAAGATLLGAVGSIAVGLAIFGPRL